MGENGARIKRLSQMHRNDKEEQKKRDHAKVDLDEDAALALNSICIQVANNVHGARLPDGTVRPAVPVTHLVNVQSGKRHDVSAARRELFERLRDEIKVRKEGSPADVRWVYRKNEPTDGELSSLTRNGSWRRLSLPTIARLVNARDHTTILYALRAGKKGKGNGELG